MATSGLQPVSVLKLPTKPKIPQEDYKDELTFHFDGRIKESDERQTEQKETERGFVTSSVVHPRKRAEGSQKICLQKRYCILIFWPNQILQEHLGSLELSDFMSERSASAIDKAADLFEALPPSSKCKISKPLGTLKRGYLLNPVVESL